jgi:outer membrane translocation and assembly module TamA
LILKTRKILSHQIVSLVFFGTALFLFGCNPTKTLKDNELFLKKNKIIVDNSKIDKDELEEIIKQHPNKKILGVFRFHLGVYNLYSKKDNSKVKENIGEPPVIFDSLQTERSVKQLGLYLNNKGYFKNQVTAEKNIKKQKLIQTFRIESGPAYVINNIKHQVFDKEIESYILAKNQYSLIKIGNNFDIDVLDKERERINTILKDKGYFNFSNNFIKYKVDTTIGNNKVNLTIEVIPLKEFVNDSTTLKTQHQKYSINETTIYIGSKAKIEQTSTLDTIYFNNSSIIFNDKLKFKPKVLTSTLNFKPKDTYSLQEQNFTYKQLSELRLFKNISFLYEEIDSNRLNVNIYLSPLILKSFTLEGVGTNTGGDLGVEGNVIYQNKNIFRGAEFLTVKLKGGLEIQRVIGVSTSGDNEILGTPFNTMEFGPEISLEIPRFLVPFNTRRISKRANPKTLIATSFNWQQRPEYSRNLLQGSFGYAWSENQYKKHFLTPFNVSFVKLDLSDEFKASIIAENNPFLLNSYTDHFISAIQYSFIFNNQDFIHKNNYQYFRFNAETSGNLLSNYYRLTDTPKDEITNSYYFAGIRYAEYVKSDIDLRLYQRFDAASLVERLYAGIGVPYGNLDVLPFEKSFFGGGSNGIRAWPARRLGPGSLSDSLINTVNQIGELKIEANIEYRFDITKLFKGAFFIDAGNIWILKEDPKRPNAEINLNRFYRDLAIGGGFGLRLDFSFFIFRFDIATPFKDPSKNNPEKYQVELKKTTLNLGIGYPF